MGEKARPRGARCPICARPAAPKFKPFCSRRCADLDLSRWLDGRYRIPTEETPVSAPPADDPEAE